MFTHKRKITLIFGKTGSGKTYKAKKLISDYKKKYPKNNVIIIDSLFEYNKGIIFENLNDFLVYIDMTFDISGQTFIIRFDNKDDIEQLFFILYKIGKLLLVVEEAEIYISPKSEKSNFLYLVRYGRHTDISIIGIARRTAELSLTLRSQTDIIYSFIQTDFNDVKKMENLGIVGVDKLKKYCYIKKDY